MDQSRMGKLLVSHPVHQHAYETAIAAQDAGVLALFATGLYDTGRGITSRRCLARMPRPLRDRVERELRRRRHPELNAGLVMTLATYHLISTSGRRALKWLHQLNFDDLDAWAHRRFDAALASRLPTVPSIQAVHAFEGAALATFESARRLDMKTILDVPSANEYFQRVELEESNRSNGPGARESRYGHRLVHERDLADVLLAPSEYVETCLREAGVPQSKIVRLPYGADPLVFTPPTSRSSDSFRVVFVGQLGLRKGVRYLLEAWRLLALPRAELILVGRSDAAGRQILKQYAGSYRWVGACPKYEVHRWFQEADVFAFPSLAEGSALATYEALATGLPVVTTPNSGSVVRDGIEGYLVPPRDTDALCDRLSKLHADPALRERMGGAARHTIETNYTWNHYRRRLGTLYKQVLSNSEYC